MMAVVKLKEVKAEPKSQTSGEGVIERLEEALAMAKAMQADTKRLIDDLVEMSVEQK